MNPLLPQSGLGALVRSGCVCVTSAQVCQSVEQQVCTAVVVGQV